LGSKKLQQSKGESRTAKVKAEIQIQKATQKGDNAKAERSEQSNNNIYLGNT